MALELRLAPIGYLVWEQGVSRAERGMSRVTGRGGELVLVEGGRLVSGTRLLSIVLK
jgi:hypothetical protein